MRHYAVLLVLFCCFLCREARPTTPEVQVNASPSVLSTSGQNVTVTWQGIVNADVNDLLAIYTPANSSITNYVGWKKLSDVKNWKSGSGSFTFPLVNTRSDFVFRILKYSTVDAPPSPIATSNVVRFANINEPLQGHLQPTSDPTQMIVMWITADGSVTPLVKFGLSSNPSQWKTVPGSSTTYTNKDLCESPGNSSTAGWRQPGFIHEVLLTGLQLKSTYFYSFGNDQHGWSKTFQFVTSPGVGKDTEVDVFAFGDLGVKSPYEIDQDQQAPALNTMYWISQEMLQEPEKPYLVVHIGDISYARGLATIWEWFFALIQPVATRAPYVVAIGNHEYDYGAQPFKPSWGDYGHDSGGECGIPYMKRFHMPSSKGSNGNLWFSLNYGPIHFVIISTEHDFLAGSPQWQFISNDLASVDRNATPWIILTGHRPMYTSSDQSGGEYGIGSHMREALEPLLIKYKVDLCFWGHVHDYERTCGMQNFTCAESDNDAPVHVVIGMAGNTFQSPWAGGSHHEQPDWVIFRTMNYGFTRFYANGTHLQFQYIGDQRGLDHDTFWLTK